MNNLLRSVLVGTDGSEHAAQAVQAAVDISEKTGAELHMVYAWRKYRAPSSGTGRLGLSLPRSTQPLGRARAGRRRAAREAGGEERATGQALVWTHLRELGLASLPDGVGWRAMTGTALLTGIGFTTSLFIGGLAFEEGGLLDQVKLGILVASVVAAVLGLTLLMDRNAKAWQPEGEGWGS